MARILLHAGFAKAGSTSLQAMMKANMTRLPEGIRYVPHDLPMLQKLRRQARTLPVAPDPGQVEELRRTARRIRDRLAPRPGETLILSSEDFAGGLPSRRGEAPLYAQAPLLLATFEAAWGRDSVEFVLYTREREAWLRSWHGALRFDKRVTPGWEEFTADPRIQSFGWARVVDGIRSAVRSPVHVLRMEDDIAGPLGPGAGLLRVAGLADKAIVRFDPVPPMNRGPSRALQDRVQARWFRLLPTPLHWWLKTWMRARDRT